jgi:8-oxo-dGTP diphosphatase
MVDAVKRDYPDRPFVAVGAVIVHDGCALVVKRNSEPLKGHWSIPGGILEVGETLRQGAAREALEETGLVIEAGEVLEIFESIYRDPAGNVQYHYVLVDFLCRVLGGDLRAGSDAGEVRWVAASELEELNLAETALRVLHKGLEKACQVTP